MTDEKLGPDLTMQAGALYQEEIFTDRRVGTIQRLTPVSEDGSPDTSRTTVFVGQTQLMTQAGPLPLSFEIPATSVAEAAEKFGDGAEQAVQDAVRKLEEMRREQSSSIIVPEGGSAPFGGGAPGGGKISMP
jgi:hypothetical protein